MKRTAALFLAACLVSCITAGCAHAQQESEEEPELVSYVKENAQLESSITDVLNGYFAALEAHDHDGITKYTDEGFIWNRNETAFGSYCRFLTECSLVSADFEHMTEEDGVISLPVSYRAIFDAPFVDENGERQESGKYEYDCRFTLTKLDGSYIITAVGEQPVG